MTEAKSGRSRRHVWIVPCLLLVPLVAGVVGVNKSFTRREAELRDLAGVVVQAELLRTQWSALEPDKDFQPVIAAMAREYGPAAAEHSWNVRVPRGETSRSAAGHVRAEGHRSHQGRRP